MNQEERDANILNREEDNYHLTHVYDQLLQKKKKGGRSPSENETC